jgi:large subunit ribosomal protein L33
MSVKMSGPHGHRSRSERTEISLACSVCDSRNYKTTRKPEQEGRIEKKKFCPTCNAHTVHKETK